MMCKVPTCTIKAALSSYIEISEKVEIFVTALYSQLGLSWSSMCDDFCTVTVSWIPKFDGLNSN